MSELITDELLEESANAVYGEWSRMIAEMGIPDSTRTFVSPGNYRLLRAALGPLSRDLAAAREDLAECEASNKNLDWSLSGATSDLAAARRETEEMRKALMGRAAYLNSCLPLSDGDKHRLDEINIALSAQPAPDDGWVKVDEEHPLPRDLKDGDEVICRVIRSNIGDWWRHNGVTHYRRRSSEEQGG